ncbi:amino acid ABC transporter permease [Pelomonas cellulosilytica]|uniref:Amino acid ABC transporter permease n=1 Tax=Pelomonas cellulosilytica TaxID=2906762 RepID=A0ABS8XS25_9BURK|nr:amino acid ABC transporter permease [Pelomonas sp. P8]MCE4553968.1 amino acid ABC transporter permease [Pelomonas sp. P8]
MPDLSFAPLLHGDYLAWLLAGLRLSLLLTGLTLLTALPLAVVVALMRISPLRLPRLAGEACVEAVRCVPLLVHMLFWYFGVPELLPEGIKATVYAGDIEVVSAWAALTLYTAAYMSEDIRSGVRAVPPAQLSAALALGFSRLAAMRLVVLPQALRITLPPLLSQTLNLWKNTSIATVIGTAELMTEAQRVESATFRGFETFALVTVAYLSVSLLLTGLAQWAQAKLSPSGARR